MAISGSTKIPTNQHYTTPSKDRKDQVGIDKEGTYIISTKDGAGGDRVDIAANKGIHAFVDTDKDDKVFLNGWKEDTSKAKDGVRYFSSADGSSNVAVKGEGTVDTTLPNQEGEDLPSVNKDPAFGLLGSPGGSTEAPEGLAKPPEA